MGKKNLTTGTKRGNKTQRLINAILENKKKLEQLKLYHITIQVALQSEIPDWQNESLLSSVVRTIVNGRKSIGGVDNREWFKTNFFGGIYNTTVFQNSPDDQPVITYNLFCLSAKEDLQERLKKGLTIRVRKILPLAQVEITNDGNTNSADAILKRVQEASSFTSLLFLDSLLLQQYDVSFRNWLLEIMGPDVKYFGGFYVQLMGPLNVALINP